MPPRRTIADLLERDWHRFSSAPPREEGWIEVCLSPGDPLPAVQSVYVSEAALTAGALDNATGIWRYVDNRPSIGRVRDAGRP